MNLPPWSRRFSKDLNEVLQGCTATGNFMGGYCLGLVQTIVAQETGYWPPRQLMEQATQCQSINEAVALATKYITEYRHMPDVS